PPLLDVLNARYIVIPAQPAQDQVAPRFQRAVQTVYEDDTVRVVENPSALPRAWLVHSAERVPPGQGLLALAGRAAELKHVALLEEPAPPLAKPDDASQDRVRITADAADGLQLQTHSTAAGLVVLSEASYPA